MRHSSGEARDKARQGGEAPTVLWTERCTVHALLELGSLAGYGERDEASPWVFWKREGVGVR